MKNYVLKRTVNGTPMEFELTDEEMFEANRIFNKQFFYDEISSACEADEDTYLAIVDAASENWESGDFETQYDCMIQALDDAVESGDIEEYTM